MRGNHGLDTKVAWFEGLDALAGLGRRELRALAVIADEAWASTGELVCRQGGLSRDCSLVLEGSLAVEVDGARVATIGAGQWVGEAGVVRGRPRSATVRALEPTRLAVFPAQLFRTVVHDHDGVRAQVAA